MTTSSSIIFDVQQRVAQLDNHLNQFFEKVQNFKNENPNCFKFFGRNNLSLNQIGIYVYTMNHFRLETDVIMSEVTNLKNKVIAIANSNNSQEEKVELDQDTMVKVLNIQAKTMNLLQLISGSHLVPQFYTETI